MKHLIIILVILISSVCFAQTTEGYEVVIHMTNFDNNKGKVLVGLFDSEKNWLAKGFQGEIGVVENKQCSITFKNIPVGVYAISVFHDENDNGKLDTNFLGIPKEDTASSNNAPARFGPPKWKDAKFEVKDKTIIQNIKL